MSITAMSKSQPKQATVWIALCGLALCLMWTMIATTSLISMSTGWIIHVVLTAVAWFQLTYVNRISKLTSLAWGLFVITIVLGTFAYTLSLTKLATTTVIFVAGIAGMNLLITALVTRKSAKAFIPSI